MSTSALELPTTTQQDRASWAAIAFIASYSSEATSRTYTTQPRLWMAWCHHRPHPRDLHRRRPPPAHDSQGNALRTFQPQLTDLQLQVLALLDIPVSVYSPTRKCRRKPSAKCGKRDVRLAEAVAMRAAARPSWRP